MIKASLTEFVRKAMSKGRISFGDVQRLQRDILPDGLASRENAELLFDLDRGVSKADPSWRGWLVFTTVDFVVWAERPTGIVDEATARWLAIALTGGGTALTRTARLIAREIAEEAHAFEGDALLALAAIAGPTGSRSRMPHAEGASLCAA